MPITFKRMAGASAVLLFASCNTSTCSSSTEIRELIAKPQDYMGREVTVAGRVTSVREIPVVNVGLFWLHDGTGEIPVLPLGALPAIESRLRVTGSVAEVNIGGFAVGLHIRETQRTIIQP